MHRWFVMLSLVGFLGCSGGEVVDAGVFCDSRNCTGCCVGTQCFFGNESTNCGHAGEACETCDSQSRCQLFTDGVRRCMPVTGCYTDAGQGCWTSDLVCHDGTLDSACGNFGSPCTTCDAGGCQNQACAF